jgi:hypothetical protein
LIFSSTGLLESCTLLELALVPVSAMCIMMLSVAGRFSVQHPFLAFDRS